MPGYNMACSTILFLLITLGFAMRVGLRYFKHAPVGGPLATRLSKIRTDKITGLINSNNIDNNIMYQDK